MADNGKGSAGDGATDDTVVSSSDGGSAGSVEVRVATRSRSVAIGDRVGRYQLEEELGEGGMATVFRARDLELRRDVAVKVLFPHLAKRAEVVARFQREARAAAALDHDHVLRVFDVGGGLPGAAGGDPPYMVLELASGPSLEEHAGARPMLAEVVAAIGVVLCDALDCAHRAGIIHRDLKPANVLVADGGRLVLGDFGVAYADDDSLVTQTGALLGTPAFMAPEQALGSELTARSDLYSLGATLYRLATGALPFTGTTAKIVAAVLHDDRPSARRRNPAVGPELDEIIDRLMARDPEQRFASAADARASLARVAAPLGEDPDEVLRRYFADPDAVAAEFAASALSATMARARSELAAGRLPAAIALAGRALELDGSCAEAIELLERGQRGRRWVYAAVGGALVVVVAVVALLVVADRGSQPKTVALATFDAAPAAADAAVPSSQRSDADLAIPAVADASVADAGGKKAAARPSSSSKSPALRRLPSPADASPERVATAETRADAGPVAPSPRPPLPAAQGTLEVSADTWCELEIDGQSRGRLQRGARRIPLPPGAHEVTCGQGPGRPSKTRPVTVEAGQLARVRLLLIEEVPVRVQLSKGSAIRIGRRRLDNGSSVELRPGRYKATVLHDGGAGATGWISVTAATPCVLRDRPALGCFKQ